MKQFSVSVLFKLSRHLYRQVMQCDVTGPPLGMSPMTRMSHPPGQMQSPLNHTISDLNVSN